jgi:hypothetical protein
MTSQMSSREKVLATVVSCLITSVVLYFAAQFFLRNHQNLKSQLANKTSELQSMKTLIVERDLWVERDAWLQQHQPRMTDPNVAGPNLLTEIKEIGKKHSILPMDANVGLPEPASRTGGRAQDQSVTVTFNAKGKWPDLVNFLHSLQGPTEFVVFQKAEIQVDKSDPTQIGGTFAIAKWFATQ